MRDLWLTALAPMLWGTTYFLTTEFLPADRPFLAAVMRALPIGLVITLMYRQFPRGQWWWRMLVLGALNIGIFFALLFVAAYRLPGGVVATIGALQPLIVIFLSWVLLREQPAPLALGAVGIGIVGVALLVLDPSAQLDTFGLVAALMASLSMAAGIVLTKYWGNPTTPLPFTAWQLVAGGLILLPITALFEAPPPTLTLENVGGYVWLGVVNTGIGYTLWFRGIKRLQPIQVSILGLFSPVVAVLVGYLFLGQGFGARQWLGIALILFSIALAQVAQYYGHKSAEHKAAQLLTLKRGEISAD